MGKSMIGGLHPQLHRFLQLHSARSQMSSPLPHLLHIGEKPYISMGNSLMILMEYLFVTHDGAIGLTLHLSFLASSAISSF